MKDNLIALNFHLFDGEGAGDGSDYGAEASAFLEQNGMSDLFKRNEPGAESGTRVEYGRPQDEAPAGQVGTDNAADEAMDLAAEWEALTGKGGKFHDLLGQKVSGAIQDRFKNQRDLQGQVDKISDDLSPLFLNYGLKSGDFEGLKNAIANDEDFYKAGAERAGLDIDQYKQSLKLQADAERGRQIQDAYEQQQRQNAMFAQWEQDADELRQAFPAFDLGMEIRSNEDFARLIDSGVDVRTAFVSTHLDDILNGANAEATRTATQDVVTRIQQRAARPSEAGLRHSPAIERRSDPSKLSNDDMDEILRRVQDGESFAF